MLSAHLVVFEPLGFQWLVLARSEQPRARYQPEAPPAGALSALSRVRELELYLLQA